MIPTTCVGFVTDGITIGHAVESPPAKAINNLPDKVSPESPPDISEEVPGPVDASPVDNL